MTKSISELLRGQNKAGVRAAKIVAKNHAVIDAIEESYKMKVNFDIKSLKNLNLKSLKQLVLKRISNWQSK